MYTEENQREGRDFSLLKGFILRLILIVIFILLLVKFVPWPDMSGLDSLKAQIFNILLVLTIIVKGKIII